MRYEVLTAVLVKIKVFLSGLDLCRLRTDITSRLRRLFTSLFRLSYFPAFLVPVTDQDRDTVLLFHLSFPIRVIEREWQQSVIVFVLIYHFL